MADSKDVPPPAQPPASKPHLVEIVAEDGDAKVVLRETTDAIEVTATEGATRFSIKARK